MEIELGENIYTKLNAQTAYQYTLVRDLVHKADLQTQITDLQEQISQKSKKIDYPIDASDNMKLALDKWNTECDNDLTLNKDYLQIQLTEIQILLDKINEVI